MACKSLSKGRAPWQLGVYSDLLAHGGVSTDVDVGPKVLRLGPQSTGGGGKPFPAEFREAKVMGISPGIRLLDHWPTAKEHEEEFENTIFPEASTKESQELLLNSISKRKARKRRKIRFGDKQLLNPRSCTAGAGDNSATNTFKTVEESSKPTEDIDNESTLSHLCKSRGHLFCPKIRLLDQLDLTTSNNTRKTNVIQRRDTNFFMTATVRLSEIAKRL